MAVYMRKNRRAYEKYKEAARTLVLSRLHHFNTFYGFKIGRVSIRDQKTRWGSCSTKGNLNFSYRIALIAPKLADYIVVHELCHLGEFNHSQRFWDLVARMFPDYRLLKSELLMIK
jgi:predicted metal-dependent hydrolase